MNMQDVKLTVNTDGSGAGQSTSTKPLFGYLEAVQWVDGTLADGVDATLTVVSTASGIDQTLLTLTNANDDMMYYPRAIIHDSTGGTVATEYTKFLIDGYLRLSVVQGGSAKAGNAIVYVRAH